MAVRPVQHAAQYGTTDRLTFQVEGLYLTGPLQGSLETPSGGQAGTTDVNRPTFKEMGIDNANIYDLSLAISSARHGGYLGAQFIDLKGSATLDQALLTHAVTFPAGTQVHSEVKLNWYRAGYQYTWVVDAGTADQPVLTLKPALGAALLVFDYRLTGDNGTRTSRDYSKPLPQVGLEIEWRPGGGEFSLRGGAHGFPALGSITPGIGIEQITASYQFVRQPSLEVEGYLGVALEQISYKDSQDVPNHIRADFGPLLVFGLNITH